MSFTQELTCRWSTSTWTPTRLLPARSFAQKLLHRSWHTGVQLTSSGSNCMWTPAKSDFSSSCISLWQILYPYRGGGRGGTKPTCRIPLFPECVARVPVSLWGSGGWGCVRSTLCVHGRNRPQPSATVRAIAIWPCLWQVLQRWSFLEVSNVSLLRFAWQAWHFVTFRGVL